jgi:hypothetical protein
MKYILLILLINLKPLAIFSQQHNRIEEYYNKVCTFYKYIKDNSSTIEQAYDLFGSLTSEYEEYFFIKTCKDPNCNLLLDK